MMAPGLAIDARLLNGGDFDVTFLIWTEILKYANIIAVILLLIIIFSQLTGYGIDNYGIKKMLPRLIVVLILINLSFVICQIAVDVSNIIGKGLVSTSKGMVDNIYNALADAGKLNNTEWGFGVFFTGIFVAMTGAAASTATIVSIAGLVGAEGFFWVIPLVFIALMGIIAFIMFFLMLAARQLITVVLVAISPIAILCYALPNTQNFFKKWLDLFKTMLVVYPVCGGLFALSKFMQAIANTAAGVHIWMVMVGLLASFVPLIAAPMMVKKAVESISALGAMLNGMGNVLKSGVRDMQQLTMASSVVKNAQEDAAARRAQKNVDAINAKKAGTATRGQRFRAFMAGGERGGARSAALVKSFEAKKDEAAAALADIQYKDLTMPQLEQIRDDAIDNANTEKAAAINSVLFNRYGTAAATSLDAKLATMDIVGNEKHKKSLQALQQNMKNNADFAKTMRTKSPAAYSMISDGGMIYNKTTGQTEFANLSHFDANQNLATNSEDYVNLGTEALKRQIINGNVTRDMMEDMLSSTNPTVQAKLQQDPKKRDLVQAALHLGSLATLSGNDDQTKRRIETAAKNYRDTQAAAARDKAEAEQFTQKAIKDMAEKVTGNKYG